MSYALGVDLGTTYTAAAVWVDGRAQIVRLGSRRAEIPSLVFVREDGVVLVGDAADRRGPADPVRLARDFKRRLGDPVPVLVGGSPYSAHALMARVLEHVYQSVLRRQEGPPSVVCVTHPANWGPYKRELLMQAMHMADLPHGQLRSEPEAAAVQYAAQERIRPGEIVAVYDLGGGTFDAAVLRKTDTGFEVLGEPAGIEQLGGVDFDEAVLAHVMEVLGPRIAGLDPADPTVREALTQLRQSCVTAKEDLSEDTEVLVPVALPSLHTRVRLNRSEFEAMIGPVLDATIQAMRRALRAAGVTPDDLHSILLAGGSSRIPLVGQLLSAQFGRPLALDGDPAHSVALGAALAAGRAATTPSRATVDTGASAETDPSSTTNPVEPAPVKPAPAETAPAEAAQPTVSLRSLMNRAAPTVFVAGRASTTGQDSADATTTALTGVNRRRRRGVRAAGAAAVAVLLVVGLAWVLTSRGDKGEAPAGANGWIRLPDLPVALHSAAVAAYQNKIWVAGGLTNNGDAKLNTTYVYDPATNAWSQGPMLPRPISHAALVATSWNLYFMAGWVQSGGSNQVLKLTPDQSAWEQDVNLPENRVDGAAAFDGTRIVYAGGSSPGGVASDTVFALRDGSWKKIGKLSVARQNLSATTNNDGSVWFVGGRKIEDDLTYGNIDRVTGSKVVHPSEGQAMSVDPPTGSGAAVFVDGSGMCLVGGKSQGNVFRSWWCDPPTGTATLPALNPPRAGLGAARIGRTIYVVGGYTPTALGSTLLESFTPPAP